MSSQSESEHASAFVRTVHEFIDFLSQDTLTRDDVAARVGAIPAGADLSRTFTLEPKLTFLASADLLLDKESGKPYLLTLEPLPDARPTPAALQRVLGDYERMRTHFDEPRQVLFSNAQQTGPWHVVILAEVESNAELERAPVQRLTFRRDAP